MMPKIDKDNTREENCKQISLINIDIKILKKIVAKQIQTHIKKITYTMIWWDLSLEYKVDSAYTNQ